MLISGDAFSYALQHVVEDFRSMGLTDEIALKLRRTDIDATTEHVAEVTGKTILIATFGILEVMHRTIVEKQREHRAAAVQLDAIASNDLLQFGDEGVALGLQLIIETRA